MDVSRKVMRKAAELLDAGVPFAMCTVASAKGSVPGKLGAKMIVLADGTAVGTVGGAGLEEKVKALGRKAIEERKGGTHKFDLAYYKEGGLDSVCGGTVEIFVEYMAAVPHILICGGGHVGLEVAKLCDQLEYAYSVLDDRAPYASRERFAHAKELHVAKPEDFLPKEDFSRFTHVVLLGYSYHVDTEILLHVARRFTGWIGAIASRTKRREVVAALKAQGLTAEQLARVEMPVGMPIGSESPAECAVSILGSIIRHHKIGTPIAEESDVKETETR
jgi:xanthine dehydrogenase accessory factor